jgi:mRNA interferase RelE/StbE
VGTSINYFVWICPSVKAEDLPNLPRELQEQFANLFVPILKVDPHERRGLRGHQLERELSGYTTIDINYLGVEYRIVYRVDDRPQAMRVDVYSFDAHDAAYDKAKNRALGR